MVKYWINNLAIFDTGICAPEYLSGIVLRFDHCTLSHALVHEFKPWCQQTLFGPKHNIYAFFMILFGLFDLIWYYYLSFKFVMWIAEQMIEN